MLKANIGLSRKLTRNYDSTGYSVNIEGELTAPLDQPHLIQQQIDRLFQLAEQALGKEIDRDQGEQAIGRRDEAPAADSGGQRQPNGQSRPHSNGKPATNGQQDEPATQKQTAYIENLRKRSGMTKAQLDTHIHEVLGHLVAINQLTKPEAGKVIESLANNSPATGRR